MSKFRTKDIFLEDVMGEAAPKAAQATDSAHGLKASAASAHDGAEPVDFRTEPHRYHHWKLATDGDIELADAIERLRFEHPQVKVIILKSGKDRVFCAGANIRMLAGATHAHKVNFCKFTNETRNAIEDASEFSGQRMICVVTGSC